MKSITVLAILLTGAAISVPAKAFPFEKQEKTAPAKENTEQTTPYESARFKSLDGNHDGKISLEEFIKDQVDDFNRRDANKDKSLSPDEFDFPPNTTPEIKAILRKQMQDRDTQEKKMEAEMQKRHEDDIRRMQEQAKASGKAESVQKPSSSSVTKTQQPAIAPIHSDYPDDF